MSIKDESLWEVWDSHEGARTMVRLRAVADAAIAADRAAGAEHIGWARYKDFNGRKPTRIKFCDSDDAGAFKVYARPQSAVPEGWKRVPKIMSIDMQFAAIKALDAQVAQNNWCPQELWDILLAKVPTAPEIK